MLLQPSWDFALALHSPSSIPDHSIEGKTPDIHMGNFSPSFFESLKVPVLGNA